MAFEISWASRKRPENEGKITVDDFKQKLLFLAVLDRIGCYPTKITENGLVTPRCERGSLWTAAHLVNHDLDKVVAEGRISYLHGSPAGSGQSR